MSSSLASSALALMGMTEMMSYYPVTEDLSGPIYLSSGPVPYTKKQMTRKQLKARKRSKLARKARRS